MTIYKDDLDWNVAAELGISKEKVAEITGAFLHEIGSSLVEYGACHLTGLGRLTLKLEVAAGGSRVIPPETARVRIYFSKSAGLKRRINSRYGPGGSHGEEGRGDEQVRRERGRV